MGLIVLGESPCNIIQALPEADRRKRRIFTIYILLELMSSRIRDPFHFGRQS